MDKLRPTVPNRAAELILFSAVGIMIASVSGFLILAVFRGLLEWNEVPGAFVGLAVGALPTFILGMIARRFRLRRAARFAEYQRVLMTASQQQD